MATRVLVYKTSGETVEVPEDTAVAMVKSGKWFEPGPSGAFAVLGDIGTARLLQLSDARRYLRFSNGSAISVTVPPQSMVAWDTDTEIIIEQAGTGQVTLVAGSGVTLRTSTTLKTNAQYSAITLKRIAVNEWVVGGDRSAS